jgi:dGTP triphosphohydrolase
MTPYFYYRTHRVTLNTDNEYILCDHNDGENSTLLSIESSDSYLFKDNEQVSDVTDLYNKKMKKIRQFTDINRKEILETSIEMWKRMCECESLTTLNSLKNEFKQFINNIYRMIKATNMTEVYGIRIFNIK